MNTEVIVLKSELDASVNVVAPEGFESRYVERDEGKTAVIYLSSHSGCDRACRMCWLTQTGQTDMTPATLDDFLAQAKRALDEGIKSRAESGKGSPEVLHFNFMARGEPMKNPLIRTDFDTLAENLIALTAGVAEFGSVTEVKFKISTIMSDIYERDEEGRYVGGLSQMPFKKFRPDVYYSLYSLDPSFRRRWLPKAEEPSDALRLLASYAGVGGHVRIHGAFIAGQNDDMEDVGKMVHTLKMYGLKYFNIVRFNSPDLTKWVETDEEMLYGIKAYMESKGLIVQMVDRVGTDVHASCGTFINLKSE